MTWHTNHSTHSTSSQEQAAASWLTSYLDTIRSERAKSNNIRETSCSPDSETDTCQASQSGTTFQRLAANPGEEQLTFFAEDSRAKTSVRRVKEQELPVHARDCGKNMRDSLTRCGLDLSLPKTHHCFALGDLELSSKTWPRWGIMLDGECSELGTSVRRTSEIGCGSWPTPCTRDYKGANAPEGLTRKDGKSRMDQLPNAVAYSGTPTQRKWGTPRCFMHKDALTDRGKGNLGEQVNEAHKVKKMGQLNPSWVAWLMGWPIGWTDLKPLVTDKFQAVQPWHSIFSAKD